MPLKCDWSRVADKGSDENEWFARWWELIPAGRATTFQSVLRVWIAPAFSKSANGAVKRTDIEIHWPILCVFLLFPFSQGERMASERAIALLSLAREPSLVKGLSFLLSFACVHPEMASFQMLTLYKFHAINHFCKLRFSKAPLSTFLSLETKWDTVFNGIFIQLTKDFWMLLEPLVRIFFCWVHS